MKPFSMEAPRFIVDAMLGTLSRKLRMLGYDSLYFREGNDTILVTRAIGEDRQILTRKTQLLKRKDCKDNIFFINYNEPSRQIIQVIKHYNLTLNPLLFGTRCLICNSRLKQIPVDLVSTKVPDYVFNTKKNFSTCPHCKKIYWKGTHFENMLNTLSQIKAGS
jgi:uncharacterized protein with PIN domain